MRQMRMTDKLRILMLAAFRGYQEHISRDKRQLEFYGDTRIIHLVGGKFYVGNEMKALANNLRECSNTSVSWSIKKLEHLRHLGLLFKPHQGNDNKYQISPKGVKLMEAYKEDKSAIIVIPYKREPRKKKEIKVAKPISELLSDFRATKEAQELAKFKAGALRALEKRNKKWVNCPIATEKRALLKAKEPVKPKPIKKKRLVKKIATMKEARKSIRDANRADMKANQERLKEINSKLDKL